MPEETSLALDAQESSAEQAGMDGFDGDAFLAALGVNEDGGDQAARTDGESEDAGAADGGDQAESETETAEPETAPQDAAETAPVMVLKNLDHSYDLPLGAVQGIAKALGVSPDAAVALMQKGMNYESKGQREARLLQGLAQSAGLDYNAFLAKAENEQRDLRVQGEMQRVAAELPAGTPPEALRRIAEQNLATQRARDQIQAAKDRQTQETEARRAQLEPFRELLRARPEIRSAKDYPEGAIELIRGGMSPLQAVLTAERNNAQKEIAELRASLEAAQKNNQNRQQATGSMSTGAAATHDAFLAGLLG